MALFVDGPSATIDDLTDNDSGLLEVAQTCGINATTKLRLAHEDIELDLQLWLRHPRPTIQMIWAAAIPIEQVVVTPALKRWEAMRALAMVYRDAYFSQLADRYQAKWDEYSRLTGAAYERFLASGIGLVGNPVRQAEAPLLGNVPGPQAGGTFYASVAWVNSMGQEGASSVPSSSVVPDGNLMTVTAPAAPLNAVGFNVYAGSALAGLFRQNDVALPASAIFTYIPGWTTQGIVASTGQQPDFVRPLSRTVLRG